MHENCCKITKKVSDIAINTANKGFFSTSISFFYFFVCFVKGMPYICQRVCFTQTK